MGRVEDICAVALAKGLPENVNPIVSKLMWLSRMNSTAFSRRFSCVASKGVVFSSSVRAVSGLHLSLVKRLFGFIVFVFVPVVPAFQPSPSRQRPYDSDSESVYDSELILILNPRHRQRQEERGETRRIP
jgi:hypothetical protein